MGCRCIRVFTAFYEILRSNIKICGIQCFNAQFFPLIHKRFFAVSLGLFSFLLTFSFVIDLPVAISTFTRRFLSFDIIINYNINNVCKRVVIINNVAPIKTPITKIRMTFVRSIDFRYLQKRILMMIINFMRR